jgi:hypothetical protein
MKTARNKKQGSIGGRSWAQVVLVGECLLALACHQPPAPPAPPASATPALCHGYDVESTTPETPTNTTTTTTISTAATATTAAAMATPPGPIRRAWYEWKMLRFPWRKRWLVGFDLQGNTFWEFKDALHAMRNRRIAKYHRSTHYGDVNVSRASCLLSSPLLSSPLPSSPTANPHSQLTAVSRMDAMATPHPRRPPNHRRTAAGRAPPRNNKAARRPRRPALGREAICPRRPRQAAAHPGPRIARPQGRRRPEQRPGRQGGGGEHTTEGGALE